VRENITACLVTRGDQPEMMERIIDSLIFDTVIVWDNSRDPDWKCAGRYMAAAMSDTDLVYYQDDDVLVPEKTQLKLSRWWQNVAYGDYDVVANWGHGTDPAGYDDLPLVCGGAIGSRRAAWSAIRRYAIHHPVDDDFMYEADFAVGVLYRSFKHVHLPFDINLEVAQHESRLCNQSWQRDLKHTITERARAIRDATLVTA
jgi:hypothetical protein